MANDEITDQGYRQEIESALKKNTSRIGDVFRARLDDADKTPRTIADELGISTVGSIYYYQFIIATLTEGRKLTDAPRYATYIASAIRGLIRRHTELSEGTIRTLTELEDEHNRVANSEQAIARENEQMGQKTEDTEAKGIPGIYVYSYPHYIRYPVIPSDEVDTTPRTYLKIGLSETDMEKRIRQQNTTAVPEPPVLLRMYTHPDGNLKDTEDTIRKHLNAADHNQNRQPGAGREWFLTHLPFVDSTAEILGLNTEYAYEEDYSS